MTAMRGDSRRVRTAVGFRLSSQGGTAMAIQRVRATVLGALCLAFLGCGSEKRRTAGHDGGSVTDPDAVGGPSVGEGGATRILIVDKATDRFGAYDRNGQIVHDYRPLLDFGAQFEAPVIWVERKGTSWDVPTTITDGIWWWGQPIGLDLPATPSGFITGRAGCRRLILVFPVTYMRSSPVGTQPGAKRSGPAV